MMDNSMEQNDDLQLTPAQVKEYLTKLGTEEDLTEHYSYKEVLNCTLNDASAVRTFISKNKPITIKIKDGELYYKLADGMDKDELFTVDTENSFSTSNKWLYNKIIDVELIFPNISSSKISNEMVSLYICILVATILGGEFETEFMEVIETYNFSKWEKGSKYDYDFMTLARDWVQMGSETVKMIAAAGKYAVTRNQKKKRTSITTRLARGTGFKI